MAGRYDLQIDQGATFTQSFQWRDSSNSPVNLTGYTGSGEMRLTAQDASVLAEFTVTVTSATDGKFTVNLEPSQTSSIATYGVNCTDKLKCVYDVCFRNSSKIVRVLNGYAYISPSTTKLA